MCLASVSMPASYTYSYLPVLWCGLPILILSLVKHFPEDTWRGFSALVGGEAQEVGWLNAKSTQSAAMRVVCQQASHNVREITAPVREGHAVAARAICRKPVIQEELHPSMSSGES